MTPAYRDEAKKPRKQTPVAQAAWLARSCGISVVPPVENGVKAPGPHVVDEATAWDKFMAEIADDLQMGCWYGHRHGVGWVCGAVSSNLEALDFDDAETFDRFMAQAAEFGLADLVEAVYEGCASRTPSGGVHLIYRCDAIGGSTKLAMRPAPTEDKPRALKTLIESKGEGGYIIEPPSWGPVHDSGRPYEQLAGGPETLANITADEREALFSLARSFDERPKQEFREPHRPKQPPAEDGTIRPGDDFNERASWDEVLVGWAKVQQVGDETRWRRPGKNKGISATTNHTGNDTLKVFSSSTEFELDKTYDKFGAYVLLQHDGDFHAAAKSLEEQGYGTHVERVPDPDTGRRLVPVVVPNPRPRDTARAKVKVHRNGKAEANGHIPHDAAVAVLEPEEPELEDVTGQGELVDPPGPRRAEGERPEILVTADMHVVIEEAVESIQDDPALYQRGFKLVTVLRVPKGRVGRIKFVEGGSPQIVQVPVPRLAELLSRNARYLKFDGRAKDWLPTRPPDWVAQSVSVRGDWPEVRPLEGIIEAPTVRPDGSVLTAEGYDPDTGLVHIPGLDVPPIPEAPTQEQAKAAAEVLFDLVADFPIATDGHRAAWLAGLLTVIGRFAIPGPTPIFLIDGNVAGAGKTWLCDLISIIATGRDMARSSYRDDDTEMDKTILSIALAGLRQVLFDNVPSGCQFGGAAFDKALTGRTFQGRMLGKLEMSPETPLDAVMFASGNNMGIKGDGLRRIMPIRLDSPFEQPEKRSDYRIKDIKGHTRENRGRFYAAALTILRGHAAAGRPDPGLENMSFPEWCHIVRNAVHWATGIDPAGPRDAVRDDDENTQALRTLVEGWAKLNRILGGRVTAAEALKALAAHPEQFQDLHDLLCEMSEKGNGGLPDARTLGNALAVHRGRPTPHGCLEFKRRSGIRAWFVRSANGDTQQEIAFADPADPEPTGPLFNPGRPF